MRVMLNPDWHDHVLFAAHSTMKSRIHYPDSLPVLMQAAMDKLALDNMDQKAAFDSHLAQAEHDADERRNSYNKHMAAAASDAFSKKAQFEGEMAEAKLAAGDMQNAFDQLTLDNSDLRAAFDSHVAKAEFDADDMKASIPVYMAHRNFGCWLLTLPAHFPRSDCL